MGLEKDGLNRQVICTRLPSTSYQMFELNVLNRVKRMIMNLGVKFGPIFMQGFVDGDTVRFYDPGMRMPGGDYDLVLKKATGFDTVKTAILFALTGDITTCVGNPKECYKLNGHIGMLLCFSVKKGTINQIEGFDHLAKCDKIIYSRLMANIGDKIFSTGDVKQRVGALGALVNNTGELKDLIEYIYKNVHFKDEFGNEMLVSKYVVS